MPESGFNTKSNFNRKLQKVAGRSPTTFLKITARHEEGDARTDDGSSPFTISDKPPKQCDGPHTGYVMINLTFRPAERDDLELLLPLFLEMERFYDAEAAVCEPLARDRMATALGGRPSGIMILALTDRPLGFASIHEMFPGSQLNAMWYLKELFVSADARGQGVGEGLMCAAAKAILRRGGSRLEFTTEEQNISAQRFYNRMGALEVPKKFYRYELESLKRLARQGLG